MAADGAVKVVRRERTAAERKQGALQQFESLGDCLCLEFAERLKLESKEQRY